MDNNVHRISYFLQKYLDGDIQKEEQSLLYHLLEESTEEEIQAAFDLVLNNMPPDDSTAPLFSDVESAAILRDIMEHVPFTQRKARWKPLIGYALAACLVGTLLTFAWLLVNRETTRTEELSIAAQEGRQDADPAQNEAILSLEGGEKRSLQDINVGDSVLIGDIKLINIDGQLSYEAIQKEGPGTQHIVQTPKGGQINMTLPDGTKVWLNADSRISFLSNLGAEDREVTVTGEVYFEVAKVDGKRFTVKNKAGEIEVLGTAFNVRAYPEDQTMETALVEGSLALKTPAAQVLLKPNQIGVASDSRQIHVTEHKNITDIIAWKNGLFLFDNTALAEVGRQLGRWYNIDVQLGEGLSTKRITGKIARNVKLSQVLEMLHYLGIETTIKDNNLIMQPEKEKAYEKTN